MARRLTIAALAVSFLAAWGCRGPVEEGPDARISRAGVTDAEVAAQTQAGGQSSAAPEMEATLWDGTTLRGPLYWEEPREVRIGETTVGRNEIRVMYTAITGAGEAGAVDVEALPEQMRPLDDAALAEYRERALEAAEKYSGVDSILCLDQGDYVLTDDMRHVYRYHALHLILKDAGRGVADISLGYRTGRSRARVLYARTISPEGVSDWAEASTFEDTVPPEEAQFVDRRGRVVSGQVPGAAVGMMVEYAYEYEAYNPEIREYFFPGYYFQSEKPVLDSIIEVAIPAGRRLNYVTRNMPEEYREPERSRRDGYEVYRWKTVDLPVITPEPFMPETSDVVAQVQGSLFFDWKGIMEPTARFQAERIDVTPEVQALADRITAGAADDDAKAAAIYHWVQRNINYLSVKSSLASGWAGHPAAETIRAGYGDCTDVSNLTASLCRAVGIEAYPVALRTNDKGTALLDIPVPDANHAIALVYPNGKARFLDPTAENFRYPYFRADDHGVKAVAHMRGEILETPVPPPEDNMRESTQEITLAPDGGAYALEQNSYTGTYEAGVRGYWRTVPPELRGRIMQQSLQGRAPGSVIESFTLSDMEDLDRQLEMEIRYSIPSLATRMRDLYIFTLPNFRQQFPEAALERREFDIVVNTSQGYVTNVTVHIPEGFELTGLPDDISVRGRHLWLDGRVEVSQDGRTIVARQVYKRLTRRVPVSDYEEYRRDAAAIAAWTDLKVVLRKTGEEAGLEVGR